MNSSFAHLFAYAAVVCLLNAGLAFAGGPAGNPPRPNDPGANPNNPAGVQLTPQQQAQLQNQSQSLPLTAQQQAQLQAQAQPRPGQPAQPTQPQQPPAPPFVLTPQQLAEVETLLKAWEQKQVKTFTAAFTRWDYDLNFGPKNKDFLFHEASGQVKYQAPDKGLFRIDKIKQYNDKKDAYEEAPDAIQEWRSDGKAIYEFEYRKKQLVEHKLPPDMQGKAIINTPLPFVFGAEAEKIKERYWVRIVTPANQAGKVWLEAVPRWQKDAANFERVEIILSEKELVPVALQLYMPGGRERQVYMFTPVKEIWNPFAPGFASPSTPFNWKRVVDDPSQSPAELPGTTTPNFNDPNRQAKQPPPANALPRK